MLVEPLLNPDNSKYTMFPIQYPDIWAMYLKQVELFWKPEEIDFSKDIKDLEKLSNNERYFISMVLAFFAASDGIVMENLAARFMTEVQISEVRSFYSFQIAMENIHSHTYSLMIETYFKNNTVEMNGVTIDKDKLFNAITHFSCIEKKAQWATRWICDDKSSFATRVVAFACVEGIFFSGAFCSIYWLKKRGLMPGLTMSNEYISRDEALHCEFAVLLYSKLQTKLSADIIHSIIRDAVEIETEFICDSLPCNLIGMNSGMMTQYIQYVSNRLCVQFGVSKLYDVTNPFPWMENISLEGKTNFFEKKVTEYGLAKTTTEFELVDVF